MEMTFLDASSHPFHSDKACALALFSVKWPRGFQCPRCSHSFCYRIRTRRLPLFECRNCRHQSSLIVGTIFENSKTPLSKWFHALHLVSQPDGICATKLSEVINVTYKTAWLILHKLRYAMTQSDLSISLTGIVRAHVDLYGRPYNPTIHLHPQEHPLIAGASLNEEENIVYAKIKQVSIHHLQDAAVAASGMDFFIEQHVETGFLFRKDICKQLNTRRFRPLFEICKQAKRWLNCTFQGIGSKHLQAYLDEFCFRLNQQLNQQPTLSKLLQLCSSTPSITYVSLIKEKELFKRHTKFTNAA